MSYADRINDTTTTTGTGDITLSGTAPDRYRNLAALGGVGTTFDYCIEGPATEWEVGIGTITGANTFSRSVQASSNANALVNFSAGTKNFFVTVSAATMARAPRRVLALGSGATPSINTNIYDRIVITALAVAITSMTTNLTGTPANGDSIVIDFTDNGTARAIAWGASFESSTISLPTTTVAGQKLTVSLDWNAATSKWRCVGVS